MEFFKDRNKLSLVLAGTFLIAVFTTAFFAYNLSGAYRAPTLRESLMLYSGLITILITGGLAFWTAWHARKEVLIFGEEERQNYSLSTSLLTVSQKVEGSGHLRASYRNGQPTGLT